MRGMRVARVFMGCATALLMVVGAACTPGPAQAPGAASGASGPRTAEGKPDFTGIWQGFTTAAWNIQDHSAEKGVPAGQGVVEGNEIPYLPAALETRNENRRNSLTADPETKCFQPGMPRIMYMPYPFQIVQTPGYIGLLFEYNHTIRHLRFEGEHPEGPIEWALGDSRARWEKDTLVVDTVHLNAETWFDRAGNFHSEAMHLVERFALPDRDHISYEITVEDPKVFTRPWTMTMPFYRRIEKNLQVLEYVCQSFIS